MTAEAKHLVDEFGALPDPAKREVLAELLRMARYLEYAKMSEDELTPAADEVSLSTTGGKRQSEYPSRGEVWLVDLGMTAKVRPCVVVSTRIGDSDRALVRLMLRDLSRWVLDLRFAISDRSTSTNDRRRGRDLLMVRTSLPAKVDKTPIWRMTTIADPGMIV